MNKEKLSTVDTRKTTVGRRPVRLSPPKLDDESLAELNALRLEGYSVNEYSEQIKEVFINL